jgi:hypothetical protein
LWLDINPKRGQDQRDAKRGGHQDRETARPPLRQLLAHGQGEDHDKQAR